MLAECYIPHKDLACEASICLLLSGLVMFFHELICCTSKDSEVLDHGSPPQPTFTSLS